MFGRGAQICPTAGAAGSTVASPGTPASGPLAGSVQSTLAPGKSGSSSVRRVARAAVPGALPEDEVAAAAPQGRNSGGAWLLNAELVVITQSKSARVSGGTLSQSNLALIGVAR